MPPVRKRPKQRGAKPADLRRYLHLPELRDRALRGRVDGTHVFFRPELHKRIVNYLYLALFTSAHSEETIALEFYRLYRHLLEGESVDALPSRLVDKDELVAHIKKILRDEAPTLREDDHDKHREREEQDDEED